MSDIRNKYVPPSVKETAFNCPHCGALAKQYWFSAYSKGMKKGGIPIIYGKEHLDHTFEEVEDEEQRRKMVSYFKRLALGKPFLRVLRSTEYNMGSIENLFFSQCYNCDEISIWIYDRLAWPATGEAPLPNSDLPDEVRGDYDEANSILDLSPRGAAALLRLAIQKLCKELGEPGKNINDDIASLVKNGLDKRVKQALDVVRVVGNNAVHPGQIDLKDDRATAEKLFGLVNLIADIMISQPKHIEAMHGDLPENAKKAIEQRDGEKKKSS